MSSRREKRYRLKRSGTTDCSPRAQSPSSSSERQSTGFREGQYLRVRGQQTARALQGLALALPAFRGLSRRREQLLRLTQVLGHLEMMPQCRKHLAGPLLQLRIIAAFGVALKQRHRIPVGADLHGVEVGRKILRLGIPQSVNFALG